MTSDTPVEISGSKNQSAAKNGFYRKHYRSILCGLLLLSPFYLWCAAKVLTPGDMSSYLLDVSHWLPQNNQLIRDMEKFSQVAGNERGKVIRISWPGCDENDHRLYALADQLRSQKWGDDNALDTPNTSIFNEVMTVRDFVSKLKSTNVGLTADQLYAQLQNVLIGRNGTNCLLVTLPTTEPKLRGRAIQVINSSCQNVDGLEAEDLRMFGGPVYTSQIDQMGIEIATRFTPISVLAAIVCAWFCLRNSILMLAVFLNAIVSTCFALVSMYLTDAVMDPLLMLIPGFWFIMSVSGGLHFVNYFFEEKAKHGTQVDLGTAAAKIALRPTFLATITTCIGLASLCTSEIMPIWRFGFHASLGLACSFFSMFLFLPSFLNLVAHRLSQDKTEKSQVFWQWYESFVLRFRHKTTLMFLALIAIAAVGFSQLSFSNKLRDQFAQHTKINSDTAWFEENIGPVIPIEVLIRFPKSNLPRPSECLAFVDALQKKIERLDLPNNTLSATAIVPLELGSGARQSIMRTVLDKRIIKQRNSLSKTGYVIEEEEHELWRLTVFVFNSVDTTLSEYYSAIQGAIAEQKNENSTPYDAEFSFAGLGARMAVITSKLGGGLIESVFVSALLISFVVVLSLRSLLLGLTAMLPNVFPVLMSFGTYGFFHSTLDIGSIMTASIAMGIAVDDTIHFMYWFRNGISKELTRVDAIKLAIRKSGRAIAATSLICGFGFFIYFFCDFMPVARFGQLMFIMLGAALIGDLFFLPALLNSLPLKFLGLSQDGSRQIGDLSDEQPTASGTIR